MTDAIYCRVCHTLDGSKGIVLTVLELQAAVIEGHHKQNQTVDITQILDRQQYDALVEFLMQQK